MADIKTNVIYLTTECNLDCGYCYERNNRLTEGFKHRTASEEEMDLFIEEIKSREDDVNSCVVIFGGEPLLRPDLVTKLMDKFLEKKPNVSFNLITNGTLITPEIARTLKEYNTKLKANGASLYISVSYDVSGQGIRVYNDGSSSNSDVLAGITELNKSAIPFGVSYVINKSNYSSILKDILICIITLSANKIELKWATQDLDNAGVDHKSIRKTLNPKLQEVYNRYGVPICEEVCGGCKRCNKTKSGNSYFIPQVGIHQIESYTEKEFDHFVIK